MYYPCSENKGADQLRGYPEADLRLCFRICKKPVFSRRGSYFKLYFFLLSIVFSVKGGDFIQRKIDYSEYPFDPVQRNNLQLRGRTMVKKIMYQTLKTRH